MKGQRVCGAHGGKSPQALLSARERLIDELVTPAIGVHKRCLRQRKDLHIALKASKHIIDWTEPRNSYPAEQVYAFGRGIAQVFIEIVKDNELRRRFIRELRRRIGGDFELPPIDAPQIAPPSAEPVDDDGEEYLTL